MRRWGGYRYNRGPHEDVAIVKEKITIAFKNLRRAGFLARQNYKCCQSCAGYALATEIENMPPEKRRAVRGVVYYHNQDNANLKRSGSVMLAYDNAGTEKYPDATPREEIGRIISEMMKDAGLAVDWDGKGCTRIEVKMPPPPTEGELWAGSGI
jgi:hypothetical protein